MRQVNGDFTAVAAPDHDRGCGVQRIHQHNRIIGVLGYARHQVRLWSLASRAPAAVIDDDAAEHRQLVNRRAPDQGGA